VIIFARWDEGAEIRGTSCQSHVAGRRGLLRDDDPTDPRTGRQANAAVIEFRANSGRILLRICRVSNPASHAKNCFAVMSHDDFAAVFALNWHTAPDYQLTFVWTSTAYVPVHIENKEASFRDLNAA